MSKKDEKPETEAQSAAPILLAVQCDLAESERVFDQLCDAPTDQPIVIDASEVEQMSTPCVLAIVSAMNQRDGLSPPAAVLNAAPPFIEAFQELGLYKDMMKMEFRT